MSRRQANSRLVYSTDAGRLCPGCQQPVRECACKTAARTAQGDGIVRLRRETSGRRGKAVIVISGLPLAGRELAALCKELKKRCGTGGSAKDGRIEIQGDHRDALQRELVARGYTVKLAGG